jgi:YgiT-type zinc finger domain-containing protein
MTQLTQERQHALEVELGLAEAPAVFCVWLDDPQALATVTAACRASGSEPRLLAGREGLERYLAEENTPASGVVLIEAGLSSVPRPERQKVNRARQRLLRAQVVVLVERQEEESALRVDYPDIFSIAKSHHRIGLPSEDEPPFIAAPRATRRLPEIPPDFVIPCPRCGEVMRRGRTTLTFHLAPEATRSQEVDGWVCSCGERYVPGDIAQEAHRRAFKME